MSPVRLDPPYNAGTPHQEPCDNKFPSELEEEFKHDLYLRSLVPQRRGTLGVLVTSLVFGLLNSLLPEPDRTITLAVHYLFLCPLLAAILASSYSRFYARWSQQLMSAMVLIFTLTYIAFEYIGPTTPNSEASRTTVVLILAVTVSSPLLRIRYLGAVVVSYATLIVFGVLSFSLFHLPSPEWNVGILFGACILGNMVASLSERNARNDFLVRRELESERQKLVQQNILLDDQNRWLGQLAEERLWAASFAEHEIRNKLTATRSAIDVALRALDRGMQPNEYRVHLHGASMVIGELQMLLMMMLNVSALAAGHAPARESRESVRLNDLVRKACHRKNAELGLRSQAFASQDRLPPTIEIDYSEPNSPIDLQLFPISARLVVESLLENAVKYSHREGFIHVRTWMENGEATVCVRDEGIGITSQRLERLFEDSYDRGDAERYGVVGTGIGLHLIKKLVDSQGGRIWATSEGAERGSAFYVAFPIDNVPVQSGQTVSGEE